MIAVLAALVLAPPPKINHPLLAEPLARARREKKTVFVAFTASWCRPCQAFLTRLKAQPTRKKFDRGFVLVEVTVKEREPNLAKNTPGGRELYEKLGGMREGIPYFAALQPDGTVVADSRIRNEGSNMGCPQTKVEVNSWKRFLSKISTLAPQDEKALGAVFGPGI